MISLPTVNVSSTIAGVFYSFVPDLVPRTGPSTLQALNEYLLSKRIRLNGTCPTSLRFMESTREIKNVRITTK